MISECIRSCLPYPVSGPLHLRKINQNWLGSAVSGKEHWLSHGVADSYSCSGVNVACC